MASRAAVLITALLFAALFVGDSPFSPHAADKAAVAESGSAFNRAAIFAALGFSLPTALVCLERVVRILTRNWPVGLMVFWSGLTYAWASLPDLVPRRAFAYPLAYLTLAILAAASRSAADWLAPLTLAFALVTALNIVAVVAFPGISRSDIGEMGMFDDKNGAGTMAMPAIVVLATALAAGVGVQRLATTAMIGLAWVFLLATRPKTSIGVAGLMMLIGPCLHLVLGRRAPVRLWAAALVGGGGTLAAVACSAAGLDDTDLRMLLFGDLTFTGRTDTWTHIVPEIARRPWLGHGFGSFWDTGQLYNPIESAAQSDWFMNAQLINTAHDGCLDVLLQTGLVGFAIAVTAILRCVVLLTAGATAGGPVERVALTGALCVAICLILNNFLESYLFRTGDNLGYLFTFLMLHGEAARLRRQGSPGVAVTVAP